VGATPRGKTRSAGTDGIEGPVRQRAEWNVELESALSILGVFGIGSLFVVWRRARRSLAGTTLTSAVGWAMGATAAWCAAWIATRFRPVQIAVLGARRPTVRVWGAFVLFPLVLVFSWPALSGLARGQSPGRFALEEPMLVGYALVLVMGTGNYAIGRGWGGVVGWNCAALLLLAPLSPFADRLPLSASACRGAATCVAVVSAWLSLRLTRAPIETAESGAPPERFDRLWSDFRRQFGLVWSQRIRDSFNETARKSGWPVLLAPAGFLANPGEGTRHFGDERTLGEMEHCLRWLLRRFVDPEWIDRRLHPATAGSARNARESRSEPPGLR
jgi:hypothetical protein